MRTTFSVRFYCRNCKTDNQGLAPLEMSIVVNGKRCFLNLPYKCRPEDFNRKRKSKELENYINATRANVNVILADMAANGCPLTAQSLREYIRNGGFRSYTIDDLFDDFLALQRKRVGVDMTEGNYRKYERIRELFTSYISGSKEVTAITPSVIQGFYVELQGKYNTSSSASYMTKVKSVIKYALDNGHLKINPLQGLKIHQTKKPIDYLTDEEIEAIKNADIDNESLRNVRDNFLLQVYSGLSYIDLEHLRQEDIRINSEGVHYIRKPRVKTGVTYTSVIMPEGVEILKRHDYQMRVISNQKMNTYLKQIGVLAGLSHNLHSHLGRKTYGHILLQSNRLETVAAALGHSSSKTTARYYAEVMPETIINEVSMAFR